MNLSNVRRIDFDHFIYQNIKIPYVALFNVNNISEEDVIKIIEGDMVDLYSGNQVIFISKRQFDTIFENDGGIK